MKKTILLLLVCATGLYNISQAQCSTKPQYLNSAYELSTGFLSSWESEPPNCDSIYGFTFQYKGASDASWTSFTFDSLGPIYGSVVFTLPLAATLTVGDKYNWRVRMITYKNNGNPTYGAWANGDPFKPTNTTASGCPYPGPLSLFPPTDSSVEFVYNNSYYPSGYDAPKKSKLQVKVDGTSSWSTYNNLDPQGFFVGLSGLIPNTKYNWRMQNSCKNMAMSDYHNGPDFKTAAATPKQRNKQTMHLTADPLQATQVSDDGQIVAIPLSPDALKVYPNPSSSSIRISLDQTSLATKSSVGNLTLKNLQGTIVWSASNVNTSALKNMNVNVSNLLPGIYNLQFTGSDNKVISQKVIISR